LGPWDHDWDMFLGYFYDTIVRSHAPIFWLEVVLDSRLEYEYLGPLIEFLAFLVQTLCQKYSKYFRNSPAHSGDFPN